MTLCAQKTASSSKNNDRTTARVKKPKKVKIFYFTKKQCAPCKIFEKSLKTEKMKELFANVRITKIRAEDKKSNLTNWYNISGYPTFLKMGKKDKVIAKIVGAPLEIGPEYPEMVKLFDDFINTNRYAIKKQGVHNN